jgi:hypothetical protein
MLLKFSFGRLLGALGSHKFPLERFHTTLGISKFHFLAFHIFLGRHHRNVWHVPWGCSFSCERPCTFRERIHCRQSNLWCNQCTYMGGESLSFSVQTTQCLVSAQSSHISFPHDRKGTSRRWLDQTPPSEQSGQSSTKYRAYTLSGNMSFSPEMIIVQSSSSLVLGCDESNNSLVYLCQTYTCQRKTMAAQQLDLKP